MSDNTNETEEVAAEESSEVLTAEEQLNKMMNVALTFKRKFEYEEKQKKEIEEQLTITENKLELTFELLYSYSSLFTTFINNLPAREDYMVHVKTLNSAMEKIKDL